MNEGKHTRENGRFFVFFFVPISVLNALAFVLFLIITFLIITPIILLFLAVFIGIPYAIISQWQEICSSQGLVILGSVSLCGVSFVIFCHKLESMIEKKEVV